MTDHHLAWRLDRGISGIRGKWYGTSSEQFSWFCARHGTADRLGWSSADSSEPVAKHEPGELRPWDLALAGRPAPIVLPDNGDSAWPLARHDQQMSLHAMPC